MKKLLTPLRLSALALLLAACAQEPAPQTDAAYVATTQTAPCADIACFTARERANKQIPSAAWDDFFAQAQTRDDIIRIMNRPGTSRPWYQFRANNVTSGQIANGIAFLQANRSAAEQITAQYGVPSEILVAVLGIETNYGKNTGSFRTADALYTLAFSYPRRAEFFQQELREFLLMSRELKRDPFSFNGSYAGAMGLPQFMPSSYRKWAKDGDGDGFADIWQNNADALASVANYLKVHGWRTGDTVRIPVSLQITPELDALIDQQTSLTHTAGEFRRLGVGIPANIADHEPAILYRLEHAPNRYSYALGLNNFYAIWQYNHSRWYVEAVTEIAEGIRAGSQNQSF